jgi:hypothetical protein
LIWAVDRRALASLPNQHNMMTTFASPFLKHGEGERTVPYLSSSNIPYTSSMSADQAKIFSRQTKSCRQPSAEQ